MLAVHQTCKSPEENHSSSSTELEMHMEVKEQAAWSDIADRGRCEAWPSFLCNVSIHPLLRRGERQAQLECLADTKEYFIAKGWLPTKHIFSTHIASSSLTQINDKMPISPQTQCKGGWRSQEHRKNSPCKLTRDGQQTPAALGDRKQARQEGQHTLFPTLLQQTGQARPFSSSFPSNFLYQCSFPAKPKGERGMLAFSTSDHVQLCEENGRAYEAFRNQGEDFPSAFYLGCPQSSLGYGFNVLSLQHRVWASGAMNSHKCSENN